MELKQLFDFLVIKFDKLDNKFDELIHEIKQGFNKTNDKRENIVTKVSQLVVISEPTSQTQPKPTFDDDEILREIELYEINNNDLLSEEELLKELGNFDIGANEPSSPNLSISTSIHQVVKHVQELQVVQSVNSNLLIQSLVKYDKSMVMVAIFQQLGTHRASHLIPTVMHVVVSIWGYRVFKFFDPGGQQNIFVHWPRLGMSRALVGVF